MNYQHHSEEDLVHHFSLNAVLFRLASVTHKFPKNYIALNPFELESNILGSLRVEFIIFENIQAVIPTP